MDRRGLFDVSFAVFKKVAVLGALASLAVLPAGAEEPAPWLGVYLVDEVDGGIRIVAVVPGGPAAVAGLRSGDLLIEAGSAQVADQEALERVLVGQVSGQELQLGVLRNGESRTFLLWPSDPTRVDRVPRPATVPVAPAPTLRFGTLPRLGLSMGLKTVPITAALRAHYGAPEDRGVLVVRVDAEGPCGRAGVEVGDVLIGIGKAPVTDPGAVDLALARGARSGPVRLELIRDRDTLVKEMTPPAAPLPTRTARAWSTREARERSLERSIAMLERRLETLREQLSEIKDASAAPESKKPANPDR